MKTMLMRIAVDVANEVAAETAANGGWKLRAEEFPLKGLSLELICLDLHMRQKTRQLSS